MNVILSQISCAPPQARNREPKKEGAPSAGRGGVQDEELSLVTQGEGVCQEFVESIKVTQDGKVVEVLYYRDTFFGLRTSRRFDSETGLPIGNEERLDDHARLSGIEQRFRLEFRVHAAGEGRGAQRWAA